MIGNAAVTSWAISGDHGPTVDPVGRMVLCVLADYAGQRLDDGRPVAWPSAPTIARLLNTSDDTVRRRLAALTDAGVIEPVDGADVGLPPAWHALRADRRPTPYALCVPVENPPERVRNLRTRNGHDSAESAPRVRNTPAHGYAPVRTELSKELSKELPARPDRTDAPARPVDNRRPGPTSSGSCHRCGYLIVAGDGIDHATCRRDPFDPAGPAAVRAALAGALVDQAAGP